MSEVAEVLSEMMNKVSPGENHVEEKSVDEKNVEEKNVEEKEPVVEESSKEEEMDFEHSSEHDNSKCAEEDCKCHSTDDSNEEDTEIHRGPIRIRTEFHYFPPEINALAMIVLLLHLLNALFQLTDKNQIQCFKRPY